MTVKSKKILSAFSGFGSFGNDKTHQKSDNSYSHNADKKEGIHKVLPICFFHFLESCLKNKFNNLCHIFFISFDTEFSEYSVNGMP